MVLDMSMRLFLTIKKGFCVLASCNCLKGSTFNSLAAIGGHDHQFFDKLLW